MDSKYKGMHAFVRWLDDNHKGVHIGAIETLQKGQLASLFDFFQLLKETVQNPSDTE